MHEPYAIEHLSISSKCANGTNDDPPCDTCPRTTEDACNNDYVGRSANKIALDAIFLDSCGRGCASGKGARQFVYTCPNATECGCACGDCNSFDDTTANRTLRCATENRSIACTCEDGTDVGQFCGTSRTRTNEVACSNGYDATNASMNEHDANVLDGCGTTCADGKGAHQCACICPKSNGACHASDDYSNCDGTGANKTGHEPIELLSSVSRCANGTDGGLCDGSGPRSNEVACSNGYDATNASTNEHDANVLGGCGTRCASGTNEHQCACIVPTSTGGDHAGDDCSNCDGTNANTLAL
jgi:hypothetical protein